MTVSEELAQLWEPGEQDGSGDTGEYEGSQNVWEMFQTALEEIVHFCLYSKGGKNRYLLPEETAKPLLRLLTFPEGMMAGNEGLVVLDTQCGAGLDSLTGTFHIHLIQFHPGSLIDIFQYHIGIKDTLVEFLESDIPPRA